MKKKELFVFTYDYPFIGNDSKFIVDEINLLSNHFKKINLVPLKIANKKKNIRKNIFIDMDLNKEIYNLNNLIYKLFIILTCKYLWKEISNLKFKNVFYKLKSIFIERYYAESIKIFIKKKNFDKNKTIFYSLWSNHSLLGFYFLKKEKIIKNSFTRILGRDLSGFIPNDDFISYKTLKFKNLNFGIILNEGQRKILRNNNLLSNSKIFKNYLGMTKTISKKNILINNVINFASCGSLIYIKNNIEIVKFVSTFSKNNSDKLINFYCIGSGPDKKLIENYVENNKIKNLKFVHIEKVNKLKDFLISKNINFFLNLSYSEGMSFSVMEAMSCNIPVIVSNIPGNIEIINSKNGYIIKKLDIPNYVQISKKIINDINKKNFLKKKKYCQNDFNKTILRSINQKKLIKFFKGKF